MLQLLGIAQIMIGGPSVYILDEPTSGLDARWVKIVRDKIKMLNDKGATIMFSSHILSEVQSLCDRVAIINNGKLVAVDTVQNLNRLLNIKPRLEIYISNLNGKVPSVLTKIEGIDIVDAKNNILFITCDYSVRINVITSLEKAGFEIKDIKTIDPSLEEAFMKLLFKDKGANQ
jgi:ABC-2 type transport system ATP-binding protein